MKAKKISPHLLDVVKGESGYVLYYSGSPLKTPSGNQVAHRNQRLLDHILRDLCLSGLIDPYSLSSYVLFSYQRDFLDRGEDHVLTSFEMLIKSDPILLRKSKAERIDESKVIDGLLDFFEHHSKNLPFIFGGISSVLKGLNELSRDNLVERPGSGPRSFEKYLKFYNELYARLSLEKKAAVTLLCQTHETGILLPLLLVLQKITPSEYANTLFSIHMPYLARQDTRGIFCKILNLGNHRQVVFPDWERPLDSFTELREHASNTLDYLSCSAPITDNMPIGLELIHMGEDYNLEFKSSLRWNLKTGRKDPAIEHACLKTISAFLNSGGGTLLIGVRDDGSLQGIESDGFPKKDKFSLHLWNLIESSLGHDIGPFIHTSFERISRRTICIVHCAKSPRPVFLNQKGFDEEFYVRIGPSSERLNIQEALKYIEHRFGESGERPT